MRKFMKKDKRELKINIEIEEGEVIREELKKRIERLKKKSI